MREVRRAGEADLGKTSKANYSNVMKISTRTHCPGCGALLEETDGPVHRYMVGSPSCFMLFNQILACEYSDPALLPSHRLTVDAYAVQHPGRDKTRQQIQSVGLHLARLGLQLAHPYSPKETNDVMLGLGKHKTTLEYMEPPTKFEITVADVAKFAGSTSHSDKVKAWALSTWESWSDHHDYILNWATKWQ